MLPEQTIRYRAPGLTTHTLRRCCGRTEYHDTAVPRGILHVIEIGVERTWTEDGALDWGTSQP